MSDATESPTAPPRRHLVDLSPLRESPAYARLWVGATVSGIGTWTTQVTVGLLLFDITHAPIFGALVGGIALLPSIIAGLWGGMLIDAFDRRRVLLTVSIVGWVSTAVIAGLAVADAVLQQQGDRIEIWPFYVFTTLTSVAGTISAAGRRAVIPRLMDADLLSRAAALNGIMIGVQVTVGPAIAGVLVAAAGFPVTFAVDLILTAALFLGVASLPALPPEGEASPPGWKSIREGLAFLGRAANIRMTFIVDIIAMALSRPHTVLPAIGATVVGGGPTTTGILIAALAAGTFLTSVFSGPVARVNRHGVAIGRAIAAYGGFVVCFGLVVLAAELGWFGSHGPEFDQVNWFSLTLAALCLLGMGVSDEVSAIFRSTILLVAAPDTMRGRLQGIFVVSVQGGPRLGDLYTGILATAVALWFPPVLGGLLIIAAVGALIRLSPGFRAYDGRSPVA